MSKQLVLERQFQALASQNQMLRAKAKKINQIQAYVNILMQSSQSCQQELSRSNMQNRQLKNQIDQLMGQNIHLQKTFQGEFNSLQNQFKRQLLKRQEQVRHIQTSSKKDQYNLQQALNDSQIRSKNDIERLKLEIFHMQGQYKAHINKVTNALSQKSRDFQMSEDSINQIKRAYLEEANKLSNQINKLRRAFNERQKQNSILKQQLGRLSNFLEQAKNSQNLLKRELNRRQQEYLGQKKTSQKTFRACQKNINQLTSKESRLQNRLNQLAIENQKLKKDNVQILQENGELKSTQKRLQRILNEKQQQIKQFLLKNQQEEQQFRRLAKRHSQQLKRVQQQLTLTNQRFICQKRNCDMMKVQIQDLINVIDKLEQNQAQNGHKIQMLNKQNEVLFKQVQNLSKQLNLRVDQLDEYENNYRKAKQNSLVFQQMYRKQSSKAKVLQAQNNEILKRIQRIDYQSKEFQQQQIGDIIENHLAQKREMLENNRIQKQSLVRRYQQALKDKDDQAKKRLQLLQDQISLMRIRH